MTADDYKVIREAVIGAITASMARKEIAVTDAEFRHWQKRVNEAKAAFVALEKYKPEE